MNLIENLFTETRLHRSRVALFAVAAGAVMLIGRIRRQTPAAGRKTENSH